jgi:hypothetical protein
MTELFVERLTATACVSDAARVRRLLSGVADDRLDQALAGAGLPSGDWCVRRVDVELRIDDRQTDAWFEALGAGLGVGAEAADRSTRTTSYRRPAQGLADLLAGLAADRVGLAPAGHIGPGDPDGDTLETRAPRPARPELALAALVEAIDGRGRAHRMLGGGGGLAAAMSPLRARVQARPWTYRGGVDRAAVADRVVSGHGSRRGSARLGCGWTPRPLVPGRAGRRRGRARGDTRGRAGAVVSALAGDRIRARQDGGVTQASRRATPSGTNRRPEPAQGMRIVANPGR